MREDDAMTGLKLSRSALVALVATASVLTLAACAPGKAAITDYAGFPPGEQVATESATDGPQAMWLRDGGRIAVTLFGSSGCPPVGTHISVLQPKNEGNAVQIDLAAQPADQACTADYAPHTTEFWTPMNVATTEPLQVHVGGEVIVVPTK